MRRFILLLLLPIAVLDAGAAILQLNPTLDELAAPKAGFVVHTTVNLNVTAEGHPVRITISATDPAGAVRPLAVCNDVAQCAAPLTLDECGLWKADAVIEYAHEDERYPGFPYVTAEALAITVTGCDIFADGFEAGNTSNWTTAVP